MADQVRSIVTPTRAARADVMARRRVVRCRGRSPARFIITVTATATELTGLKATSTGAAGGGRRVGVSAARQHVGDERVNE